MADDLKTAKASGCRLGAKRAGNPELGKLTSYWVWVKYAVDFIEENGSGDSALYDFLQFCSDYYILGGDGIWHSGNAGPAGTGRQTGDGPANIPSRSLAGSSNTPYKTYDGNTMTPLQG